MVTTGGEPHLKGAKGKSSVRDKVATFYYTLGLFCISYPICILLFASLIIGFSWYPLINLPLPGKAPVVHTIPINPATFDGTNPFCYIQQIIIRLTVMPWNHEMMLGDAFRAPIYEVFKLLEIIRNFQDNKSSKSLSHVCLHIEATKRNINDRYILPQYSCLVLSPANLWNQDIQAFLQDNSLLSTIFNHHSIQKGKVSVAEMLFGMNLLDTGIKRYPIRNRQRIIQYAVTLILKEYDPQYIDGLRKSLTSFYPLFQDDTKTEGTNWNDTIFIQYPGEINCIEHVPLIFVFIVIFFYYYFSVRKIEVIKCKLSIAFAATFTIFCNLTMTMGICFFFGLTLRFEGGKSIFPYLALLVSLENVLVLTKSISSTPHHLDVKIRYAQGLSREGWSITKNILFEITVLTFGLFTLVPAIQEFCIFSIVALITDYFLQIFFFLTLLGLDISRHANSLEKTNQTFKNGLYQPYHIDRTSTSEKGISRSRSHPRLPSLSSNIIAAQAQSQERISKRVKLVNVWARTRFFQRSFMLLMIIWISLIAYRSDIISNYLQNIVLDQNLNNITEVNEHNYSVLETLSLVETDNPNYVNYVTINPIELEHQQNYSQGFEKLRYMEYAPWLKSSARYWPEILKRYNLSLSGEMIMILPTIKLAHVIRPEQAVLLRNPDEKYGNKFQWQTLAAALDPINFKDESSSTTSDSDQPFFPTSPMEIFLTTILCSISVIVLVYALIVLYRCVCSRNYAEWRASWHSEKTEEKEDQVLLEALPVVIDGHHYQIECLASNGKRIVSICLGGHLKVWDSDTGELEFHIDRRSYFSKYQNHELGTDLKHSVYYSESPTSRDECFHKLLNKINTEFPYNEKFSPKQSDLKYDFHKAYRYFYYNHNYDLRLRSSNDFHKDERSNSLSDNSKKRDKNYQEYDKSDIDKEERTNFVNMDNHCSDKCDFELSPVWCMDYLDNLIVVGCANGRLEFWDGSTGNLQCVSEDGKESGITNIKLIGIRVLAVRLCGTLELFQIHYSNQMYSVDENHSRTYRRTHVRSGSVGSMVGKNINKADKVDGNELQCQKVYSVRAHQQPITCLDCEGGCIVTGSQDHTVKVFRLEDSMALNTLHGHCGPITCLFIDRLCPAISGSGSQDGMLCVWDLVAGACMYSIQAHDGGVTSLAYSTSYVISLGKDERLCVWERFQGHLLNTIHITQTFSNQVLMLAQHFVVTCDNGGLVIWDVRTGECVRTLSLGRAPFVFIKQLILLRDAVLCDYGHQLRIIRFPLITHKFD